MEGTCSVPSASDTYSVEIHRFNRPQSIDELTKLSKYWLWIKVRQTNAKVNIGKIMLTNRFSPNTQFAMRFHCYYLHCKRDWYLIGSKHNRLFEDFQWQLSSCIFLYSVKQSSSIAYLWFQMSFLVNFLFSCDCIIGFSVLSVRIHLSRNSFLFS